MKLRKIISKLIYGFVGAIFIGLPIINNSYSRQVLASVSSNQNKLQKDLYIIGPGDELSIKFAAANDLSNNYTVLRDGTIPLPLIGSVYVRYLTLEEAEAILIEQFSSKLLVPELSITIKRAREIRVSVVGEVNRPGLHDGLGGYPTVLDAIRRAGGITHKTDLRNITLLRRLPGPDQELKKAKLDFVELILNGDQTQNIYLFDGDIIQLSKAKKIEDGSNEALYSNLSPDSITVQIIGQVIAPGSRSIPARSSLMQAIMAAGGPRAWKANKSNIEVFRINRDGTASRKRFKIDLTQRISEEDNPTLLNGDLVRVNANALTRLSEGLGAITEPITGILNAAALFKLLD